MNQITDTVKHLIIINVIMYIATYFIIDSTYMVYTFSLHAYQSPLFKPWQLITHMFMHGDFSHLLFNMLSLWMFGTQLEGRWGQKKFITFYLLTGMGAALVYLLIKYFQIESSLVNASNEAINLVMTEGAEIIAQGKNYVNPDFSSLNVLVNGQLLGASAAISGLLMAFGILYPEIELALIFLPIPIKAKYFIPLLIIYELSMEFVGFSWDNVAHLAHLSGMLIGFILMKFWAKNNSNKY